MAEMGPTGSTGNPEDGRGLGFLVPDAALDDKVAAVAARTRSEFGPSGLTQDQFSIAWVELDRERGTGRIGAFQGGKAFYPASVVKMFWMAFAEHLAELGEIDMSAELERALTDMIRDSSNDATALVVDVTTGTTGGPELSPESFVAWAHRRNAANRWFRGLGYVGINVCQKTWCEGPYGRERQFYGELFENRNALTADATARLMAEIATDQIVTPERCSRMRRRLQRLNPADSPEADSQATDFSGRSIPSGARLWSKAGWTSDSRNDAAWIHLPDGREVISVVFTKDHSSNEAIIPFIVRQLIG
ncbi:MAG: serine hydrolase [Fimbriimonadaceae bacterium]